MNTLSGTVQRADADRDRQSRLLHRTGYLCALPILSLDLEVFERRTGDAVIDKAGESFGRDEGTAFFDDISLRKFAKGKYFVNVFDGNKLIATKEIIKL